MSDRSLIATEEGIKLAKNALTGKKLTQEKLMELVDVQSRSTISNFFTGKPVDRQIFVTICEKLEINWQEISGQLLSSSVKKSEAEEIDIEALVKLARERCAGDIQKRCGTMRVLDMEQPVALSDIYTDVNILQKITRNQRKELDELMDMCRVEDFYRWGLSGIKQERVEGIKAVRNHSKLMILGKPGAGKTTFLKFLAMSCINGDLFADRVPIFVTLKDFADEQKQMRLFDYIVMAIAKNRIAEEIKPDMPPLWINWESNKKASEHLVQCSKLLILLDGLDEVREKDDYWILKEIRDFAQRYDKSQIVITCRIAAKQYIFEQFTEVEVADFDKQQIATFAENWFRKKEIKAKDFLEEINQNNRVQELATNPLLLTLLCLAFEESGSFPTNRAELYKEGLDALLRKWDSKRGIRRDSVYKDLSVQKKEDMLSQIALTTFEKGDYFVKQRQLEDYICDYIRNTANAKTDDQELHLDSEAVLKSIEAQHGLFVERARGIYSFSHLTFHEYFAARQIVVSTSPSKLETALQNLVTHVTDKRWREVILLSVGMAREADDLLLVMKEQIDRLLAGDDKLQNFLTWADEKSRSVNTHYKLAAVRSYYFDLARDLDLARDRDLDLDLARAIDHAHALDRDYALDRARNHTIARALDRDRALDLARNRVLALDRALDRDLDRAMEIGGGRLYQDLQALKEQLPDPQQNWNGFKRWWKQNGEIWIAEYRQAIIAHRNIGHDWQFTEDQIEKLKQYYNANLLLVECLKSDCYVRRETRQAIEESLLLPSKR